MAEWVSGWADAAFTDLECAGYDEEQERGSEYFSLGSRDMHSEAKAKFAIAIDDESLTSHLRSAKVTLRSSVYRQWYDARLVPWLHYMPLDDTLVDLYGVMEFFLGSHMNHTTRRSAHDDEARRIAEAGKD